MVTLTLKNASQYTVSYLLTYLAYSRQSVQVIPALLQKGQKPYYLHINQAPPEFAIDEVDQQLIEQLRTHLFQLEGEKGGEIFEQLMASGRLHFSSFRNPPLKKGPLQKGHLSWIADAHHKKRLHCRLPNGVTTILPFVPLMYIDPDNNMTGELNTILQPDIAVLLLFSVPLTDNEIQEIYEMIKKIPSEKERQKKIKACLEKISRPLNEKTIENWYVNLSPSTKSNEQSSSTSHWLELEMGIEHEGKQINLLPAIADLVRHQLNTYSVESLQNLGDDELFYIDLPDQKKFALSGQRLKKIVSLFIELYDQDNFSGHHKLRLSTFRALQLTELKQSLNLKKLKWHGDDTLQHFIKNFKKLKSRLSKNTEVKFSPPKNFLGELRHYQQAGLQWLQFLSGAGLSGILADDMGLGKTVQVLAHLQLEKNKSSVNRPTLIISPTSLLMNWMREANRFTPSLNVLMLYGSIRKEKFNQIPHADIVLTSYALLVRDEEILSKFDFNIVVLDEAQYIKNHYSKAGHTARKLIAKQRLCLTGTPLENHLGELWTIFHFLLPGLLGDKNQFARLFRTPIEKENNTDRLDYLKQRISPFFLRRTKHEVLKDLPEKIDITRSILMSPAQQELYENARIALHEKVILTIEKQGLARSQIFILDALLKLRQICCDPRLLKNSTEYSAQDCGKLSYLLELLPELISEGRKILLFSQFTQMLALIEPELKKLQLPYLKLTGQSEHRENIIDQFQLGDVPLFLVSLKAGGVGLNLTKADTVIHYDPWWNPAVEDQASSRAHRIGQDKTVFVYKLLTSGSIEEKITALQDKKRAIFDATLSDGQKSFSSLTKEDIENIFAPVTLAIQPDGKN